MRRDALDCVIDAVTRRGQIGELQRADVGGIFAEKAMMAGTAPLTFDCQSSPETRTCPSGSSGETTRAPDQRLGPRIEYGDVSITRWPPVERTY